MSLRRTNDIQEYWENLNKDYWENSDIEFFNFNEVKRMPYGMKRRNALYDMFQRGMIVVVNGKNQLKTYTDPDLKKLIKQGKIEIITSLERHYTTYNTRFKRTYVRIKDGSRKGNGRCNH